MRSALAAAALAALLSACAQEYGPLMAPGEDCIACHDGRDDAQRWTVAGTWTRGAHIDVTDANGKTVSLRGNKVGNFYTAEPLVFPITVVVDGVTMPEVGVPPRPLTYGGCNICHTAAGLLELADMASGRDCLVCHTGGVAKKFYAAGSWVSGATVQLTGANATSATLTARPRSGNFYVEAPLTSPITAVVNGSQMNPSPTYGGCNACHGSGGRNDD